MKVLNSTVDLDQFFSSLKKSPSNILFLDYDGTLAPFNVDPNSAVPYPGIRDLLLKLLQCRNTRLVIVTGRYTKEIIPLLSLDELPEIWGSHGLERLHPDGEYEVESFSERTMHYLEKARVKAETLKGEGWLEEKPGCVALHWRGLDQETIDQLDQKISPLWNQIAEEGDLKFKKFDGGLEVRVPGKDKGDAVTEILEEMSSNVMSAYLGDDLTDEDAFTVLEGRGLRVLVRGEFRPTKADLWIQPPQEMIDFLHRWPEACP